MRSATIENAPHKGFRELTLLQISEQKDAEKLFFKSYLKGNEVPRTTNSSKLDDYIRKTPTNTTRPNTFQQNRKDKKHLSVDKKNVHIIQKINNRLETETDFYLKNDPNDVSKRISSIKDSIANAYLFSESSLSPMLQMYFKNAVGIKENLGKEQKQISYHQNNQKSKFLEDEFSSEETPIKKRTVSSPQTTTQNFINDKLQRMQYISGNDLIVQRLESVKNKLETQEEEENQYDKYEDINKFKKESSKNIESICLPSWLQDKNISSDIKKSDKKQNTKKHSPLFEKENKFQFTEKESFLKDDREAANKLNNLESIKQPLSTNADPNNTSIQEYFGKVEKVNLSNLYQSQLGLSEDQKQEMIAKMDPCERSKILQRPSLCDKIQIMKKSDITQFQKTFMSNFNFIQEQSKHVETYVTHYHLGKSNNLTDKHFQEETSINKIEFPKEAKPMNEWQFGFSSNSGNKAVRVIRRAEGKEDLKKEFEPPLYINRINRVRINSMLQPQENKQSSYSYSINNQSPEIQKSKSKDQTLSNIKSPQNDPRNIYRQKLESILALRVSGSSKDEGKRRSESPDTVNRFQEINKNKNIFFQNYDIRRKLLLTGSKKRTN